MKDPVVFRKALVDEVYNELREVILRYQNRMTIAEIVGVLECLKVEVINETTKGKTE